MSAHRYFTTESHGDATVARSVDTDLQGVAQAEFIKEELIQILATTQRRLVIDFCDVRMISSSAIAGLLVVKSRAQSSDKSLSLTMTDTLRAVFGSLNLDGTVFDIYASVAQALQNAPGSDSYYDVCGEVSPPDEDYDVTASD